METLAQKLGDHHYVNLETFRRNGLGIRTPVWFVADGDHLFFSAPSHTGKVKRLRNSGRARIAPCDGGGKLLGDWVDVEVRPIDEPQAQHIDQLIQRKYGLQRRALDLFGWIRRWKYVLYVITPATPGSEHQCALIRD